MEPILIGDKERFAVEIGEFWGGRTECRRVDLWAANRWLTCDDNTAHVEALVNRVRWSLGQLSPGSGVSLAPPGEGLTPKQMHRRARKSRSLTQWQLLTWGSTTDNVLAYFFRIDDRMVITFEFWRDEHEPAEERGEIFVVQMPEVELVGFLEQMVEALI